MNISEVFPNKNSSYDEMVSLRLNNDDLEQKLKEVQETVAKLSEEKDWLIGEIQYEKLTKEVSKYNFCCAVFNRCEQVYNIPILLLKHYCNIPST